MERYHYLFFFQEVRDAHSTDKSTVYKGFAFKVNEMTLFLLAALEDAYCILHLAFFS